MLETKCSGYIYTYGVEFYVQVLRGHSELLRVCIIDELRIEKYKLGIGKLNLS
jgi:hypothetical protein